MENYLSVEFIDDYRLLCCLSRSFTPKCLVVIDTGKPMGPGVPMKTLFHLPSFRGGFLNPPLLLEHGAHKPSPEESQAPFYWDPTQRIIALHLQPWVGSPIFKVGVLLKLLEGHEGSEVEWDEWKSHVVIPSFNLDREKYPDIWVSGCRLFSIDSGSYQAEVYDYSMQACVEYLSDEVNYEFSGLSYLSSTGAKVWVPWRADNLVTNVHTSHDGIVFSLVSVIEPCSLYGCNLTMLLMSRYRGLTHLMISMTLCCTSGSFN